MTKKFFDDHSQEFLSMALSYEFDKKIKAVNAHAYKKGSCGDAIEFFLNIDDGIIQEISFNVYGCLNTRACANTISYFAQGKTLQDAWQITPEAICTYLKSLPDNETHCAELACNSFFLALTNYTKGQKA